MAIFRAETKHISRGKGHNVVAAAAYRAAEKLTDTNKLNPHATTHDYTNKKGVVAKNIVLPTALSNENFSISRQELWSSVEEHATTTRSVKGSRLKKSARLAREWLLALPSELSDEENEQLTAEFTQHLADELGVIGDYCIHRPTIENYKPMSDFIETSVPDHIEEVTTRDGRPYSIVTWKTEVTKVNDTLDLNEPDARNIHAHIMFTTHKANLTADGKLSFSEKVHTEKSDSWRRSKNMVIGAEYMKQVRELWAGMVNKRLAQHDIAPISHKSYKDLGLDIQPQHKEGKSATVFALHGFTPRVRGFNNGYKERNRDAIKSASDSCITLSNEAKDRAIRARNDANAGADRTAAAAREADDWLSTAATTPFDRKRGVEKLDEQTRIFNRFAEQEDKITVRRHGELIEQAIEIYWSVKEWTPYLQRSDWAKGGMRLNPDPDPSDAFNHRQMDVIKNISKHLEGVDNNSYLDYRLLRESLGQPSNERILTLLTNPKKEQFQYEQDKNDPTEIITITSSPSLDTTQEEESAVDHEERVLTPRTPSNTYKPSW